MISNAAIDISVLKNMFAFSGICTFSSGKRITIYCAFIMSHKYCRVMDSGIVRAIWPAKSADVPPESIYVAI